MGFNEKSWIENYVHNLSPLTITHENVEEEISRIVDLMNELFNNQNSDKYVVFRKEENAIIFPGRKSNISITYNIDDKSNELKIIRHKKEDLNSEIQRAVLINCKVEEYLVKDEPSITMDEMAFDSLKDAINCAFSRILN